MIEEDYEPIYKYWDTIKHNLGGFGYAMDENGNNVKINIKVLDIWWDIKYDHKLNPKNSDKLKFHISSKVYEGTFFINKSDIENIGTRFKTFAKKHTTPYKKEILRGLIDNIKKISPDWKHLNVYLNEINKSKSYAQITNVCESLRLDADILLLGKIGEYLETADTDMTDRAMYVNLYVCGEKIIFGLDHDKNTWEYGNDYIDFIIYTKDRNIPLRIKKHELNRIMEYVKKTINQT